MIMVWLVGANTWIFAVKFEVNFWTHKTSNNWLVIRGDDNDDFESDDDEDADGGGFLLKTMTGDFWWCEVIS